MKRPIKSAFIVALLAGCFILQAAFAAAKDRVLVFCKTKGWHHTSIPAGIKCIQKLGAENNFDVDTSSSSDVFTPQILRKYKAVIFLSPTGSNILTNDQKAAFKGFINHGGGFVGIHAATDCCYEWDWYNKLVGAFFKSHPAVQAATVYVTDANHPATKDIPKQFQHTDEWYNFKDLNPEVTMLMRVDESTYNGGILGATHPVSWYHAYDGGRAFYTALGHTDECYTTDEVFIKHLLGGINYALGRSK